MNDLPQHQDVQRHEHRGKWVLIGFLAVAAFFMWTEHRAHLLGALPYLLVLACPLMHLFHHGHHRHHHGPRDAPRRGNTGLSGSQEGEQP